MFAPLLSLQASAGFVWRTFLRLWEMFSRLPEVVLHKGKQNAYLGFCCRTIFYDNVPSFRFLLAEGLERLTNFSSRRANVKKRGLAIGLFCGTNF